jgi:hypothetical protein
MGKRGPDRAPDGRIPDNLCVAADLEGCEPPDVDRLDLVYEDDRVEGLTGGAGRDGDLARILCRARGDGADPKTSKFASSASTSAARSG